MPQFEFPRQIDSTANSDLSSCMTRFFYSTVMKIIPKHGTNTHLHFGGCFALGLEVFRKEFYGVSGEYDPSIKAGINAIINEWGQYQVGESEPQSAQAKTLDNCVLALDSYFSEYPPDIDVIKPKMTPTGPAVEFTFALPIPGIEHPDGGPILYAGRFDMLGEYGSADFIDDEKTTYQLGSTWPNQFKLSGQITGYVWCGREFGFNVQGAIIRGVGIQKSGIKHLMVIEYRPQWMIDRWMGQLQRNMLRAIECWKSGIWDQAFSSICAEFGGCKYLNPCTWEEPEGILETEYKENTWNPLEK